MKKRVPDSGRASEVERLYEIAPVGLCYFDTQLRFRCINEWLARINGLPVEAHLGKAIDEVLANVADGIKTQLRHVLKTGEPIINGEVEAETPAHPGESRSYLHDYYPDTDSEGTIVGISCVVRDVTELRHTESELRESEALLRQAAQISHLGHFLWDEVEDRCIFASEEYAEVLGVTVDEALTRYSTRMTDLELTHPDDRERVLTSYAESEARGGGHDIEYRIIRPDGVERHVREVGDAKVNHQGRFVRTVGVLQDITEQKKAREALEESEDLLRQAARTAKLGHCTVDVSASVYLHVSEEYANIFGYSADEFLSRYKTLEQDLQLVHPDDRATVTAAYNSDSDVNIEYRVLHADGNVRTVIEMQRRGPEVRGSQSVCHSTLQDITEVRHIEARARELKVAQQELTKSLADARRAEQLVKLGTYEWDWTEDRLVACSEEYARIHELSVDETLAASTSSEADYSFVHPADRERYAAIEKGAISRGEGFAAQYRKLLPSGRIYHIREVCEVKLDDQGKVTRSIGSLQDVTEQVELEEQLRQAQKMEAVGTLAGGIAHDFNNLLTAINGHCHLILEGRNADDPLHRSLSEIARASDRAATLTRQLLAFSRKQIMQPELIDVGQIVVDMKDMLRRLIGEHIELVIHRQPNLHMVHADPGQMDQVIMNLVVNARDAMTHGGKIIMSVENEVLDGQSSAVLGDNRAGDYVMISISDTGVGMEKETLTHIFEPFYTTKGVEEGTGLGLSTVFGIVKQSGGGIEVESDPGKGSTFRIYLPQVEAAEPVAAEKEEFASPGDGRETILVVEDEAMIRALLERILKTFGYRYLTAQNGDEALLAAKRHDGPIDLMITDVVMPRMSGYELAERLAKLRPEMSVLYISGYDEKMVTNQGIVDLERQFLHKPFRPKDIARKIREILDGGMTPPIKDDQAAKALSEFDGVNI